VTNLFSSLFWTLVGFFAFGYALLWWGSYRVSGDPRLRRIVLRSYLLRALLATGLYAISCAVFRLIQ